MTIKDPVSSLRGLDDRELGEMRYNIWGQGTVTNSYLAANRKYISQSCAASKDSSNVPTSIKACLRIKGLEPFSKMLAIKSLA